jgi:hypothetical protein
MKLKIRSTIRPCLVTTPSRSKTLVVGGTITHVNGEEWDHPYCAVVPGGVITLDDIEWEYAGTPPSDTAVLNEWKVDSATDCKTYIVIVTSDVKWTCTCPHFTYRKQICKHIKEWQ